MNKAIEVIDLSKSYIADRSLYSILRSPLQKKGMVCALHSLSFAVEPGRILGVVGPNGAGKTTLLKILAGLLQQDRGKVEILGLDYKSSHRRVRGKIGYVSSDERSFFWRLSGRDNLEFFARLYCLSPKDVRPRVDTLLKGFQFEKKALRLFSDYSAGMRKKVAVMRALLHQPEILLLDEVTNSLDPDSSIFVKTMIRNYIAQKSNRAAIWCTHRLEEIPHVCDRVISIDTGEIVSESIVNPCPLNSETGEYVVKTKPMNGQLEAFCSKFHEKLHNAKSGDDVNEFTFKDIDDDELSKIVTVAVKDYGAYVLFAGYLKKDKEGGLC